MNLFMLASQADDATVLLNRALIAIVTLLVAVVAYFLKQVADDIRTTRQTVDEHGRVLARHGVMYEMWLDDIANALATEDHESPKRRSTDILRDMIKRIADNRTPLTPE